MIKVEVLKQDKKTGSRPVGATFLASEREAQIWGALGLVKFEGLQVKAAPKTATKRVYKRKPKTEE